MKLITIVTTAALQTAITQAFTPIHIHTHSTTHTYTTTILHSLKPAATPLMDSGKALARSGELLIDATSTPTLDIYGGGLSSAGANIRNAGDCVAQAAASCRFKTAAELVTDELREAATCLLEGVDQLKKAMDDAEVDGQVELKQAVESMVEPLERSATTLEAAGAGIMKKETYVAIGEKMFQVGESFGELAILIQKIGEPDLEETKISGQRMLYAAEKMREAGNNLRGIAPAKKKGKSWLKG